MKFLDNAYKIKFEGINNGLYRFKFISIGGKEIIKVVSFSPIKDKLEWYNLGFGNLEENEENQWRVNDIAEDNNSDFEKVLTTVFNCILYFLHLQKEKTVLFFGNTVHKNELYKKMLSKKYEILFQDLDILGGRIKNSIPQVEKESIVKKRKKIIKRKIHYKDLNAIQGDILLDFTEQFNKSKHKHYQFILFSVK